MKNQTNKKSLSQTSGFTLLEMLLVIAIIAILASIVIIAINPGRQLAQARNAQRASDLNTLDKAIKQFYIDYKFWPASTTISSALQQVCDSGGDPSGCLDLSELVPDYIASIPADPSATEGTNYYLAIPSSNEPELLAASSTEYSLTAINIGTTTTVVAGGGGPDVDALRTGLVGYWPMDTDGTITDESTNSNNGTISGAIYNASGKVNGSYEYDDDSDTITVSGAALNLGTGDFSFQMWAYLNTLSSPEGAGEQCFLYRATDTFAFCWKGYSGGGLLDVYDGSSWRNTGITLTTGWNFLVVTRTGTSYNIYHNDNAAVSATYSNTNFTGNMNIGSFPNPARAVDGRLDEVAIWSRELTSDEVTSLYNSGSGVSLIAE